MKCDGRSCCRTGERGSVLIVGLWVLLFLSTLALAVGRLVGGQLELAHRMRGRSQAYYIAKAGVEQSIVLLEADTNGWDGTGERWAGSAADFAHVPCGKGAFTASYQSERSDGSVTTNYGLTDECGKIDVNEAGPLLLRSVLEVAGQMDGASAARLADQIVTVRVVRVEDQLPGGTQGAGFGLRRGPFDSIYELQLVDGMEQTVFDRIRDHVTVYGGSRVNLNTADRLVLVSLACCGSGETMRGAGEGLARKLLQFREGGHVFTSHLGSSLSEDLSAFVPVGEIERQLLERMVPYVTVSGERFRGVVCGSLSADTSAWREVNFVWDRSNRRIRFWHED
jgi:general secretion pathway protein K